MSKKQFQVIFIDKNGCATNELYTCTDITVLFAILAKELVNKDLEYDVTKIIVEEVTNGSL